ncbi:hypothetical protein MJO29_002166 [Puccinia striiformis f. sp. tritici]|uniref:hypothetical protein n=1 Tax=Puccinia striiformis f. sp. tritici TaxID=168172 RepID=UPI002007DE72|nr:hypothetical protein Pst134EA_002677 [Puccinia striiformis f. sp. tritici]KAH9472049.1 hypothetical protein Pst134EA_002677 [Puccinia striiformis f. sp. tritici]KAI7966418.1 hypothetical protein MJO29_002166 [Puccinia striiformis f. sp. tritici]KAI9618310.1 hypothetical protein KEM48_006763 [Puccinia striiformis f. sp. tritici PST-130]
MNLPTYSLTDSPNSTILNVCLGIPPSSKPAAAVVRHQTDLKGKAPQRAQEEEEEEEEWSDAEYRRSTNPRINTISPWDKFTGWDEHFATANSEGWNIYRNYPLQVIDKKIIPNGSLKIVMPLHRTNLIYLVGGPPSALYSSNKVIIYDLSKSKPIMSIEFSSPVLGLTGRLDKLVVVLLERVIIFEVNDRCEEGDQCLREEGEYHTCPNPKGLVCLATNLGSSLLVFPALQAGKVQVVHLPKFGEPSSQPRSRTKSDEKRRQPPYPSTSIIVAHTTPLASLAITPCGKLIATASVTGTLLRIWNAKTSALVRELRRGTDGAIIWGLRFRPDGNAICASSDKGTIHLWNFDQKSSSIHLSNDDGKSGGKSSLDLLKPYLPKYFHSTWSDYHYRLPGPVERNSKGTVLPGLFGITPIGSSFPGDSGVGSESGSNASYNYRPKSIEDDVSLLTWIIAPSSTASTSLEPQIAVITRSGAWFRLRIPAPSDPHPLLKKAGSELDPSDDPKLNVLHESSVQLECVEYRRFGDHDDWSDDDLP